MERKERWGLFMQGQKFDNAADNSTTNDCN